jgi:hypothetical protein
MVRHHSDCIKVDVHKFADGYDPTEVYVIQDSEDGARLEQDLVLLYSPKALGHKRYPILAKFSPKNAADYKPIDVHLLAYNGADISAIREDYPHTDPADLKAAYNTLLHDRLSCTAGKTGLRYEEGKIYNRCSSLSGASGGPLTNEKGELIGIKPHKLTSY